MGREEEARGTSFHMYAKMITQNGHSLCRAGSLTKSECSSVLCSCLSYYPIRDLQLLNGPVTKVHDIRNKAMY